MSYRQPIGLYQTVNVHDFHRAFETGEDVATNKQSS